MRIVLFAIAVLGFTSANAGVPGCPIAGTLKLTVGENQISLNDNQPVCVALGGTFTITIKSHGGYEVAADVVRVEAKDESGVTIEGKNVAPTIDKLVVTVDGTVDEASEDNIYKYWIYVGGVGQLDPKVRVVGSAEFNLLKSQALEEAIDVLNLTPQEATNLLKESGVSN